MAKQRTSTGAKRHRSTKQRSSAPLHAVVRQTGVSEWATITDRDRIDWLQEIFESGTGNFWMELWVEYKNHSSLRAAMDHAISNW